MKRGQQIEVSHMLKILECIYTESKLDVQMSQTDIAREFGVHVTTMCKFFSKLVNEKILATTGKCKSFRYRWIAEVKPTEGLAIRLGATKLKTNKINEFSDQDLIKELKNRGYLVFKEC